MFKQTLLNPNTGEVKDVHSHSEAKNLLDQGWVTLSEKAKEALNLLAINAVADGPEPDPMNDPATQAATIEELHLHFHGQVSAKEIADGITKALRGEAGLPF